MITRMLRPAGLALSLFLMGASPLASSAYAQSKPKPRPAPAAQQPRSVTINGYAMGGRLNLTAVDSFEAITGTSNGTIIGGGVRVGLPWVSFPWGGLFVDAGAWRYQTAGERVFVLNGTVYPLNVPVDIAMTPIELSAGWEFRFRQAPKLRPYVAAGVTSMIYKETSSFASAGEDVEETFGGYHALGGAEYRIARWVGIAGEFAWSTVPDSIGQAGVSEAFNDTDLGGTSFRVKITIGR
jgi:hypothetical protein